MLKRFLFTLMALIIIVIAVGLVLPSTARVERSIEIDAPADRIYPLISDFRQFNRWSPWLQRDPDMQITHVGPAAGRGAKMLWSSKRPDLGAGSQEIVAVKPGAMVKTLLDFGPQGTAFSSFQLQPQANGRTRVSWRFVTDFGFDLVGRYFGLWMDRLVGPDYEQGLENLKRLAEAE